MFRYPRVYSLVVLYILGRIPSLIICRWSLGRMSTNRKLRRKNYVSARLRLVFREERKRDEEKLGHSLVFRDITSSSFTQINEESVSGKPAQPTLTIRATRVVQPSEQTSDAQRSVDEIKTTLATLIKFQLKYDVDAVDKLLAPEFLYVSNDGLIVSRVEFINLTDREKNPLEVLEVTDVQVQLSGDTAVATGIIHEKGLLYGKPYEFRGRTLITYARRSGRWLCLAIHD